MRSFVYILLIFLFLPAISFSGNIPLATENYIRWNNIGISIPTGYDHKEDNEKMFFSKKIKGINNFVTISTMETINVDDFINGLRNDGKKIKLLSVHDEIIEKQKTKVVMYRITEDDINKIMISYFIQDKNIRIIYYGFVDEFINFEQIIYSLKFSE